MRPPIAAALPFSYRERGLRYSSRLRSVVLPFQPPRTLFTEKIAVVISVLVLVLVQYGPLVHTPPR